MHVLKGAKKTIEETRPQIFLELHKGERFEKFDHEPPEVIEFLESHGYDIEFLDNDREVYAK